MTRFARLAIAATAASIAAAPLAAHAQTATPRFSLLGGASIAKVSDFSTIDAEVPSGSVKTGNRIGFQLGAALTMPLSGMVSFQPEVHYIQKGAKITATIADEEFSGEAEANLKLAYLEVPLLLRVDMGSSSVRPFLVAGPSLALRVGCTIGFSALGLSGDAKCDEGEDDEGGSAEDPFKKTDFGGIVGLGLAGGMGGREVSVQVRYSRGFTTIAKETVDGVSPKNSGISVLFGIGF